MEEEAVAAPAPERQLEEQLLEAGNKLLEPPAPVEELLPLLDRVEGYLSRVEQSPAASMQTALSPSVRALVAEQLFRHVHVDVKVGVASCVSEITRITAPDAPYDDDKMKEVFELIVSAFKDLADSSSRSYVKRTSILETVAKVRSCVIMLDLELDNLIIEMFKEFFKAIRDYHPENVFKAMETIMTLVIDETEEISPGLLQPILDCLKKDNQEVQPIAQKLAEKVLEKSASKIKKDLSEVIDTLGHSVDDFSEVVTSICQQASDAVVQNDVPKTSETKAHENETRSGASGGEASKVDQEIATEAATEKVDPEVVESPISVMSNGIKQTGNDDSLADLNCSKKDEHDNHTDKVKDVGTRSNVEPNNLESEKAVVEEQRPEQYSKRKGKISSSVKKMTEPSDGFHIEKEGEAQQDDKNTDKGVPSSTHEEPAVVETVASENEKDTGVKVSTAKETEGESAHAHSSPTLSGTIPGENSAKRGGLQKVKGSTTKETTPSADDVPKKASEGTGDQETKQRRHPRKRVPTGSAKEEKTPSTEDASKKDSGLSGDSEAKQSQQPAKKFDGNSKNKDRSTSKKMDEKKKGAQDKAVSGKDITKSSTEEDMETVSSLKLASKSKKEEHHPEKTPKTNSKRKHTPVKASDVKEFGENLVGLRVKVYWPHDSMFYEGAIHSFDAVKKKHKVSYDDGDEEILNLKREKWEIIGDDSESDGEQPAEGESRNASSEKPPKKKAKTSSDQSTKPGKMDASSKKAGGASSSKTKAVAEKSGGKSKDKKKADEKPKESSKSENENVSKSKDQTAKSGSKSVVTKLVSKSKNDAEETAKSTKPKEGGSGLSKTPSKMKQETPKTVSKPKQETPKASTTAKGKSPKTAKTSSSNGTGKLKTGSSKGKESEDVEESTDSAGAPETKKVKSPSKAQETEARSGKKRRRGSKN